MSLAPRRSMPRRRFFIPLLVVLTFVPGVHAAEQGRAAPEGWAALEAGDASKAAAIFRDALDRNPRSAELHYGAAYAARLLGRTDAAMSSLRQAVDCDPRMAPALVMLAQLAYETTDLDLAITSLEKASALLPRNARIAKQLEAWRAEAAVHNQLNTRTGARFTVLFEGPAERPIADRISRVLDAAYWRIGKMLSSYPSRRVSRRIQGGVENAHRHVTQPFATAGHDPVASSLQQALT